MSIVSDMCDLTVEQCGGLASTHNQMAYPPPVAAKIPTTAQLQNLRNGIIDIASGYGFPVRKSIKSSTMSDFDVELGNFLLAELYITPAEAGVEEVWSFLSLVLVPDVVAWRFPNKSKNPEFERWIGRPRNVLRKAWWRAYVLGPALNTKIGEDEGVNIMERPTFGMNPLLARIIVEIHISKSNEFEFAKSEVLRRVMVQLGKFVSFVDLDCLPEEQLRTLVEEAYDIALQPFIDELESERVSV
ncbi:DUF6339 family protein [Corynebacterium lubricantis]|uniref:DUF6339 family protein n=1 Tax=Corynebacterium lubricantis TaxID=541095 RepID=UPI000380162E|nr:DUF6339 family protein [Corynebacterium lubricantis]